MLLALVAGDAWYLFRLYDSIKVESLRAVGECLRRADILEIISRLDGSRYGGDSSFIKLTLMIQRENDSEGGYGYPGILENVGQTMSEYFHIMEMADTTMSGRDYAMLDSLFRRELADAGLRPEVVFVRPFDEAVAEDRGLWSVDFALREGQPPLYRAYFSGLGGHVLRQMAGILVMSGGILLIAGFLIWYLLHWVGKLKSIEQMKDDFTHNMTHELKTPVAVAYAAADSMLRYYDQSDEARNRRFLGIILQRLGFLSGMIENILSMSMERFRSLKLNIEEVDVREVVEEVAGMIEMKAAKPVRINVEVAEGLKIQADSLHFGNVISNLLDNAVKYSNDSVEIDVRADRRSLSVADNGIGISRENLPHIFDKFYRVNDGDKYETGGYGLGLYYVKQIASMSGWRITVESRPGMGSVFTIRFDDNEERQDIACGG